MKIQTFLFGILLLAIGCRRSMPDNVLPPKEMENVLYDMHIVDSYLYTLSYNDSLKKTESAYRAGVYKKYGIDSNKLTRSKNYYYQHADLFKDIYGHIIERLNKEKDKLEKISKAELTKKLKLDSIAKVKKDKLDSLALAKKKADSIIHKTKTDSLVKKKKKVTKPKKRKKKKILKPLS